MNQPSGRIHWPRSTGHDLSQEVLTTSREGAPRPRHRKAPQKQMLSPTLTETTKGAGTEITGAPLPRPGQDLWEGPPRHTHRAAPITKQHQGGGSPATHPRARPQAVRAKG